MIELLLRIGEREVRIGRILAALIKLLSDADAPTVIDNARATGDQRIPAGLVHRAIITENDAVLRARIAVFRADDLCVERHAVHLATIAVAGSDATHMGTV
ncbi:Uncharacterised protein [Serratia proteamaculans]|nr:Uncharacterised protein [Serratia proteamaculans]CAI2155541.1 Uncharacterised protein [Serratia proteamaculans]